MSTGSTFPSSSTSPNMHPTGVHELPQFQAPHSLQPQPEPLAPSSLSPVGAPVPIMAGPFAGFNIRAKLIELQKADLGRKYGIKDRRPLDPPPVALLRLFFVHHSETAVYEEELDCNDVNCLGMICHADLYRVSGAPDDAPASRPVSLPIPSPASFGLHNESFRNSSVYLPLAWSPLPNYPIPQPPLVDADGLQPPSDPISSAALTWVDGQAITEYAKCTDMLAGSKVVLPVCVNYQEKAVAMFVFSDISVKTEGVYLMRYHVFDLVSTAASEGEHAAIAECFGRPFTIYSTKAFPGLRASTDLTKFLAHQGVRLASRAHKRERRRFETKNVAQSQPPRRPGLATIAPAIPAPTVMPVASGSNVDVDMDNFPMDASMYY